MHDAINISTPVVILRSAHHGGLGIARSLGRLGVRVYIVNTNPWEPACSSRYCRGRFVLEVENGPPARAVASLLEIGRKLGGQPILIPTTDPGATWVAQHAAALRQAFCLPCQDADLVCTLCDKGRMQELARRNGVPTAQSVVPRSKEDVVNFL